MQEIAIKTHLIITDIHNEYYMNWCGRLIDTKPIFDSCGCPTFVLIGSEKRMEVNTFDINVLEDYAKQMVHPKGNKAISHDSVRIYIREEKQKETLLGVLTCKRIKTFAPMFDKVGFK